MFYLSSQIIQLVVSFVKLKETIIIVLKVLYALLIQLLKALSRYCPSSQPCSNIWHYTLQAKAEEVMCLVSSDDLLPCSPSPAHAVHGVVSEARAACTEHLEASPPVPATVHLDKGYGWHIKFSHRPALSGYVASIYMHARWELP